MSCMILGGCSTEQESKEQMVELNNDLVDVSETIETVSLVERIPRIREQDSLSMDQWNDLKRNDLELSISEYEWLVSHFYDIQENVEGGLVLNTSDDLEDVLISLMNKGHLTRAFEGEYIVPPHIYMLFSNICCADNSVVFKKNGEQVFSIFFFRNMLSLVKKGESAVCIGWRGNSYLLEDCIADILEEYGEGGWSFVISCIENGNKELYVPENGTIAKEIHEHLCNVISNIELNELDTVEGAEASKHLIYERLVAEMMERIDYSEDKENRRATVCLTLRECYLSSDFELIRIADFVQEERCSYLSFYDIDNNMYTFQLVFDNTSVGDVIKGAKDGEVISQVVY